VSDAVARQLTEEFIAGVGSNGTAPNGRVTEKLPSEPAPAPAPPSAG
jgi:hypothetical protein